MKTLTVVILANSSARSSLSQATTIATALKAKGAVPKFLPRVPDLRYRRDVLHRARHSFYGVIVVDGADDLFLEKASSATLYSRDRA